MPATALGAVLLLCALLGAVERAEACSSRSTPKPRPPAPTPRPNVTFHTYACPPAYAAWYCLNGATCFTVKIAESLMYSCECSDGYMGNRCEFKDLDGSYLPVRQRVVLERASIASGASIAVILVVVVCMAAYVHCQRRRGVKAPPPSPPPALPGHAALALPCRALPALPPGPGRPPAPPASIAPDWPWHAPIVVPVVALHRPCRTPAPTRPPRPPPPSATAPPGMPPLAPLHHHHHHHHLAALRQQC